MRGHVEVVRALLASRADRSIRNRQGCLAIDLCQPQWSRAYNFTRRVKL